MFLALSRKFLTIMLFLILQRSRIGFVVTMKNK